MSMTEAWQVYLLSRGYTEALVEAEGIYLLPPSNFKKGDVEGWCTIDSIGWDVKSPKGDLMGIHIGGVSETSKPFANKVNLSS